MSREALNECVTRLHESEKIIAAMEVLLGQALAARQRLQYPSNKWADDSMQVLRLLSQDRKEKEHVRDS